MMRPRSRHLFVLMMLAASPIGCVGVVEPDESDPQGLERSPESSTEVDFEVTVPSQVDHSSYLPPVRSQGSAGTCLSFATVAAVEGFYGLKKHLAVMPMIQKILIPIPILLDQRVEGVRLPKEEIWPYDEENTLSAKPPAGLKASARWGIDEISNLDFGDEKALRKVLAAKKTNNIIVGIAYDFKYQTLTMSKGQPYAALETPFISDLIAEGRKRTCGLRMILPGADLCGGHAILLVGYRKQLDDDGVARTYFKFRNSWSSYWGENGYGWISSEYLRQLGMFAKMITSGPKV